MVFPVVVYGCESWTIKKAECRRIDAFELWCWRRLLREPWTAKRSNQSILKEISPWVFIGRTDIEAETPRLWPPDVKSWLIGKDPDAGKDWGREKETTEDEMVGWHHWLDGHGFGWTLGVGDGQGGLACCSSWGRKELDMTEPLNWTEGNRSIGRNRPSITEPWESEPELDRISVRPSFQGSWGLQRPTRGPSVESFLLLLFELIRKFGLGDPLVAQLLKNLSAMQETLVWFLGWEDTLEKGIATHSSILAWRIP